MTAVSARAAVLDESYQLEDCYTRQSGRVYLTGSQALVRLPIMQRQRDALAGLNTAGFISGYTGSPLGIYDNTLRQARAHLEKHHVHFQPGVNEDLAATAVWGSQQVGLIEGPRYDGVFGIWYGKGPGVDRSGDALKHGSYAGSAAKGGVLVLAGDDHGARSSTTAHQSDHAFIHCAIPYLNPAGVQDYIDFGLYAFALSRYSGCWVGMKCVTDTVESAASIEVDLQHPAIVLPEESVQPAVGRNLRWGVPALAAELRQYQQRLPAAQEFVYANGLDRVVMQSRSARLGIVTSGKAYLDVMQALEELCLDAQECERLGLSVYKVAVPWPLEPRRALAFARVHEQILVVEEKRAVIEDQLAKLLFNAAPRPRLIGKQDESGAPLIRSEGELTPVEIAIAIGRRLLQFNDDSALRARVAALTGGEQRAAAAPPALIRLPSFCAGCPHNLSTKVPEGSTAFAGIGCHGMATFLPERRTPTLSHMGAEGASWIGIAPFSATPHIFQNLGDGTYYHSGLLAIRAAVAAGVNITYKILVNDSIAMTGGQRIEGQMTVADLTRQLHAEGVLRIAVVSDNTNKYAGGARFAPDVTVHHRDELDAVQRQLREYRGVSAIVYDQHCATELRRRRKRGAAPDPDRRSFINERVCEGCGDCGVQSNCIAIEPVETEFGRKRRINQSACNKDFSCQNGYCPSFVTLVGATARKRGTGTSPDAFDIGERAARLPLPAPAPSGTAYNILIAGVGGSGVITLGALLGMAAHLEGKACSVLDVTGLAQRNGAVTSHVRIANTRDVLHSSRIASVDLLLGSDMVVCASREVLDKFRQGRTRAVVNSHVAPTSAFARNPDLDLSGGAMRAALANASGPDDMCFVEAAELANALMGNEVATNLLLLGYAFQRGWLPVSLQALERAIELNGVSVSMNKASLQWGRLVAHDPVEGRARAALPKPGNDGPIGAPSLDEIVQRNEHYLTQYQSAAYSQPYRSLVEQVRAREKGLPGEPDGLTRAVARYYFKLLAYKDEYEVARLHSDPEFRRLIAEEFEGNPRLRFSMAPPLLSRRDKRTGRYRKREFGPWVLPVLRVLAALRCLRGTVLDVFGYSRHRRTERALIAEYRQTIEELLGALTPTRHAMAVEIASLPEQIRGYDVVKEHGIEKARALRTELLARFRAPEAA